MGEYRQNQRQLLESMGESVFTLGQVTTVNLTMIEGGVQDNVIPSTFKLTYDCRVAIDASHVEHEAMVNMFFIQIFKIIYNLKILLLS